MTDDEWKALLDRQAELEALAVERGVKAFDRNINKATRAGRATQVGGGALRLMHASMPSVVQALTNLCVVKGSGRRHVAERWITRIGAEKAAFITLRAVLDGIGLDRPLTNVALQISTYLRDELRFLRFQKEMPGLFAYKMEQFRTANYGHKQRSLNASLTFADLKYPDLEMTPNESVNVGSALIHCVITATSLVRLERKPVAGAGRGYRKAWYLCADEDTQPWINKQNDGMAFWKPCILPMVVPPRRWIPRQIQDDRSYLPPERGGYRYTLRDKYPLVKGVNTRGLEALNFPLVYVALNNLQNTAWRVNTRVLDVATSLYENNEGPVVDLPACNNTLEPEKPHDFLTNATAKQAWKKQVSAVKAANALLKGPRIKYMKTVEAAKEMRDFAQIWFPHNLDHRGRMYPITQFLSPQGDDFTKGLLTFASGKVLDQEGAFWLAVHGATCFGKALDGRRTALMTFEERVAWTHSNTERILAVADSPTGTGWWRQAKDKWQFLAFAFEWANLIRANDRGDEYVCSLPVTLDGSANAFQHWSALLRDPVGAQATNVIPQERPQDIYTQIAEKVLDLLEREAVRGDTFATRWLGLHSKLDLITRDLLKSPIMTSGYGASTLGLKTRLIQHLKADTARYPQISAAFLSTEIHPKTGREKSQVGQACGQLVKMIQQAFEATLPAAFEGMKWMRKATRGITKQNNCVRWRAPITGFPVELRKFRTKSHTVQTILLGSTGKRIRLTLAKDTAKVNANESATACPPSFIHSIDAAMLAQVIAWAGAEDGIRELSAVHDCFATVPSDVPALRRQIMRAFGSLYPQDGPEIWTAAGNVLAEQWKRYSECPIPPLQRGLDLSSIDASTYLFS